MYFYLFLAVSFLYYCCHCGTVHLHPDTILRKHGVHQRLKCLVVVKARKPRLEQSRLCSCHLVVTLKFLCHQIRHQFIFYPQEMLQTPTSIWVLPKQFVLSLYHLTLPLSSASNQPDYVGSHRFACSPPVFVHASLLHLLYFFLSFRQLHTYHLHQKAGSTDTKLASLPECSLCRLLYLSICDSVWKLPVCLLFQFRAYHFSGWTGSPSSCNSSVCHSTFAHSY